MVVDILMTLAGLTLLVAAGDLLVRGAVALALKLAVPALVISATVVAFGTSAPELLISIEAALSDAPGIALGNVIGSNIANVWLVLGVPALIAPLAGCAPEARRSLYFMLIGTVLFTGLMLSGTIGAMGGLALLVVVAIMIADSLRESLRHRARVAQIAAAGGGTVGAAAVGGTVGAAAVGGTMDDDLADLEDADPDMAWWKVALFLVVGIIGLPSGASLLIDGAQGIARAAGVSEAAIGLTLVAIGTSLPELATTVMAALRNQTDVAIGNVVGSNMFNITAVIGAAALFAPLQVPAVMVELDIWIMLAATAMLVPYVLLSKMLCRWTGAAFVAFYIAFVVIALG
ncbi:MAG: calcium/sodium antiporter [Pseudomonadota bacterium]